MSNSEPADREPREVVREPKPSDDSRSARGASLPGRRLSTEVCIDSVDGAHAAEEGGASRLELCANLLEGGTTPSTGMIRRVCKSTSLPVMVMIRPRGGHFCFDAAEIETMIAEAEAVLAEGVAGIVMGALRPDGQVDEETCGAVRALARDCQVTFHRAFDHVAEPFAALEILIGLGIDRVLTSGQAPSAWEGRAQLRKLIKASGGRISIMPGGGIRADNVQAILQQTGAAELHFSASRLADTPVGFWRKSIPMSSTSLPGDLRRRITCVQQVRAICQAVV